MEFTQEQFEALKERNIKCLAKTLFPNIRAAQNLTYSQLDVVRKIAFSEVKRLNLSAFTRWGKTQCVAIGVAIYILLNNNKKVKFIGPTNEQAGLIRDYMSELIIDCEFLSALVDLDVSGVQRLKKETSKNRLTFKNGCEYRIISAHGKGFAAMGHGGDLIIMDEAALISREAYAKITRMLGDDPEKAVLIELYNPWDRNTKAFDHSISPRFERIEIGWKLGIKEGRTTQAFIDEMAEEFGGKDTIEFQVLYESRFPDESKDSIHSLKMLKYAEDISFDFLQELAELRAKLLDDDLKSDEIKKVKAEIAKFVKIVSCDPADQGIDKTVIMWGIQKGNRKEFIGIYSESKSDPMILTGKILHITKRFIGKSVKGLIKIDVIGIGSGPVSRCKEVLSEWGLSNIRVISCHNGQSAINDEEFKNKKAENNFRLRDLFNERLISLKQIKEKHPKEFLKFKLQMLSMKWKYTSTSTKIIVGPDKSPDYNDAGVYFSWEDKSTLAWGFV